MLVAPPDAVFFDLDGTLADTAPDLASATNRLLVEEGREPLPLAKLRPHVSHGATGMLRAAFSIEPGTDAHAHYSKRFLAHYEQALCVSTRLFDGMEKVLQSLEAHGIKWGIVTNKRQRYTLPLMAALQLDTRASCIISGDSAPRPKPAPDTLLLACSQAGVAPSRSVYVGDDLRDIQAARAADMPAIAAAYGYLGEALPVEQWEADAIVASPLQLLQTLALGVIDSTS